MITIQDLVGEWELENFNIEKPNGIKNAWGNNMHGLLIYTTNGYMSVSINKEHSQSLAAEEKFKNILFYAGTYEVIDNKIVHHVQNATDINRIGKDMIREAQLENDKLTLIGKGDFGAALLTWKRIIKKPELKISQSIYRDSPLNSSKKSSNNETERAEPPKNTLFRQSNKFINA